METETVRAQRETISVLQRKGKTSSVRERERERERGEEANGRKEVTERVNSKSSEGIYKMEEKFKSEYIV